MKVIIIVTVLILLTTSCGKEEKLILIDSSEVLTTEYIDAMPTDKTDFTTEHIEEIVDEIPTIERGQGGLPSRFTLINNVLHFTNGRPSIFFEISDAEYVGKIKSCPIDRIPVENFSSNEYEEGIKIYKLNEYDYVLEFKNTMYYTYVTLSPIDVSSNNRYRTFEMKSIKIEDSIYRFNYEHIYETYDLNSAEYLGEIEHQLPNSNIYIPTENYTSNFCAEGSKVYRIDEFTIVVEYEKDNKVFYEEGKIY